MLAPWWQRLPSRLLDEDRALSFIREGEDPIVRSHRWVREPDGEPRVRVTLAIGSGSFDVEVRFPRHYPDGCPSVRPIPYDKPISSHQFEGTGVFCLELGPDNWHPRYTAADMIVSAWRLIVKEIVSTFEPIEIPSRHVSDLAEQVRLGDGVLVRSPGLEERLRGAEGNTEFDLVLPSRNLWSVFPVSFPKDESLPDALPALSRESHHTGLFVRLSHDAPERAPTALADFDEFINIYGQASLGDKGPLIVLAQWPDGRTRGFMRLSQKVLNLVDLPLDTDAGPRTPADLRARLAVLKFCIVGTGSLGSKVAVSLARSGARRFTLVDGDVHQGPNVCRNEGGYADIGALKVDVVKEIIRDVSHAEPEITRWPINLASPTNPEVHARVLEDLGSADVLIDATANPEVFGIMAMLASERRHPLVWGEVFGGGLGGLVASAHPDHGPCPRCVRAGFLAEVNAWPPAPAYETRAPYEGGEDDPLVATDADIAAIAAALTKRVFNLVMNDDVRPPAVMLLGLRHGWIFEAPFHAIEVRVRSDDWSCARCWKADSLPDAETSALAEGLFSPHEDAHDPPVT